jgi:hypothetical protein
MEFTTLFELQSQATRLVDIAPYADQCQGMNGPVTLSGDPFPRDLSLAGCWLRVYGLQFSRAEPYRFTS